MRSELRVRVLLVASLLVAAGLALPLSAAAHEANETALDEARDEIARVEDELEDARRHHLSARQQLAAADARLARLEAAVNEVARALHDQELEVAATAERVAELEADIDRQREAFSDRAADLYKRGAGVPLEAVLSADSMEDALGRGAYVQALSASDRANLEDISAARITLAAERDLLERERQRLAEMKAEREDLLARVEELREQRALAVAEAKREVNRLENHKQDLEAESQRIEELIRAAERQRRAAQRAQAAAASSGPSQVDGSGYAWPRCDSVTSEYGYRWGRRHEGIDIDGNTGSPIYASKDGAVIFAGWQGGYGRLTLVDHGDGVVTAYAHQSAQLVSSGQHVSRGQLIGRVGTTGYSTGAHLHFETRVNGSAVNPRRFLPSSC